VVVEVRKALFDGGMVFRPRCRLPMGLTVTRVRPLEQDVGGLRVTSQRAVLPLLFDTDSAGKVRFERQPLPGALDATESRLALADFAEMGKVGVHPEVVLQALLASAAFPLAFRPRVLCECATMSWTAPATCATKYHSTSRVGNRPPDHRPSVTAGFRWQPEMWPMA
jgi:hypothetical protein